MASGQTTARTATAQAMPRWKRSASDAGHGSTLRPICRPCCEVVQVDFTGQALHTVGEAR